MTTQRDRWNERACALGYTPLFLILHMHYTELYPSAFDSLALRESKIQALLHCFHPDPDSPCGSPVYVLDVLQVRKK